MFKFFALAMVSTLCILSTAYSAEPTVVDATATPAPSPDTPPTTKVTRTLEDLGSPRQSLKLTGVTAAYSFSLPISPRENVVSGVLHLETTNSTALIQKRSELAVSVNGKILAQYQLDPEHTQALHDIVLGPDSLKPGYNDIRISVVQHYTDDCENPLSPELWTQIDGARSSITLGVQGFNANPGPRLTQLSTAFDRRGWVSRRLTVVSGSDSPTEPELSAAALAVQGLSLRLDYRPLGIDVLTARAAQTNGGAGKFPGLSPVTFTGKDVLLVGKRAEISRYLSADLYSIASGPFVGAFAANEGDSVVIVVTGSTDAELLRAAKSLANPEFKYSDLAMGHVESATLPLSKVLVPGTSQTLDTLGFRTQSLSMVGGSNNAAVEFRAPGHFAARKGDFATLNLHLSYSAGLRKSSNLAIFLNGTFIKSVALDNDAGTEVLTSSIKVPAQAIKPGINTLSFEPKLMPLEEKQCARDTGGTLTIFEDSKFELPEPTVTAKYPDLDRYARSLFPQDVNFTLVLTNRSAETAAAGLELMALIAQHNRTAVLPAVTYTLPATGHVTLVGPFEGLPDAVQKAWPLNKYFWVAEGNHMGVLQAVENKRVLTGFFARDSETLREGISLLRTRGFWRALAGSAAVIDTQEQSIRIEGAQDAQVEDLTGTPQLGNDWRVTLAIIAAGVAVVALLVAYMVRRRINRRQLKAKIASEKA